MVRRLLGSDRDRFAGLLAGIRTDVHLWQASDADLATVDLLWDALLDIPGVGTASGAKLLARKRPRLCPITDKVVIRAVGPARADLGSAALPAAGPRRAGRDRGAAAAGSGGGQPAAHPDVAIWVAHSDSRAAQRVRLVGPGPGRLTGPPGRLTGPPGRLTGPPGRLTGPRGPA